MHNLTDYIIAFGYVGIFVTIFAESGFLLGFFLPGDSLLFTLGILSSTKDLFNIYYLVPLVIIAAILGDSFGYYVGRRFGSPLFDREDSFFFKKKYVERTQEFYKKHGKKTIILARFVPIVRTFAPIFAGIGQMNYRTFFIYNVIGGVVWGGSLLVISYYLGTRFPHIENYLSYIIIAILVLSVLPIVFDFLKKKQ